jgi:hypothetical protein
VRPDPARVPVVRPAAPAATPDKPVALTHHARPKPPHAAVPPDLASALRPGHQVDVSAIPVHRGPEVAAEARTLGARAFARGGEVFLPADAGPLDTPRARGLLAHELVHAVQQRTLGTTLPAPDSPAGRALEAEAVAAEHAHAGPAAPAPLVHPSLTQVIGQAARTVGVQLAPLAPQTIEPPVPSPPSTSDSGRAPEPADEPARPAAAGRTIEEWTAPEPDRDEQPVEDRPAFDEASQDQAMSAQILQVINVERAASGLPSLTALDAPAMDLVRQTVTDQTPGRPAGPPAAAQTWAGTTAEHPTWPAAAALVLAGGTRTEPEPRQPPPATAPVPPPVAPVAEPPVAAPAPVATSAVPDETPIEVDRIDLEALAARLYDRLRSRIRMELLIDRERAGLLTDFR